MGKTDKNTAGEVNYYSDYSYIQQLDHTTNNFGKLLVDFIKQRDQFDVITFCEMFVDFDISYYPLDLEICDQVILT